MNVALYGHPRRWAMTERGAGALSRDAGHIAIGASAMTWDGRSLTIEIDETTVPLPSPLRGQIHLTPRGLPARAFDLDAHGRHRWQPIAPLSDVTVTFERPATAWRGTGYFDTNHGSEPLEAAFRSWTWSRFDRAGQARIFYDVVQRDNIRRGLSLEIAGETLSTARRLPYQALGSTFWGIPRAAPCEQDSVPAVLRTLENAPFYARSAIRSRIDGIEAVGIHESLSLDRVTSPIVRLMLPFKMFRR